MNKIEIKKLVTDMCNAFSEFEEAIEHAQKMYHNYNEWTDEELNPIQNARTKFWDADYKLNKLLDKENE